MFIEFMKHEDNWTDVKKSAFVTIGKDTDKYPDSNWKRRILIAEHSPIRKIKFNWKWRNLMQWVHVHFVRHHVGIEHWVRTERTDRTGINRNELPQGSLIEHECVANAQALINISRKRLCNQASAETRSAWEAVKVEVEKIEPELASCMVPECIYRGFCPEFNSCRFYKTDEYNKQLKEYRSGINGN